MIIIFLILLSIIFAEDLTVIDIHEAWEKYKSSAIKSEQVDFNTNKMIEDQQKNFNVVIEEKLIQLKKSISKLKNFMEIGIIYAQNGFYKEALKNFEKFKKLNPTNSSIYINIANINYLTGEYPEAINNYLKSLKIEKDSIGFLNLAFIYYELGEFEKAKQNYFNAIMLEPSLAKNEYSIIINSKEEGKASNKGIKQLNIKWIK